ncbi:phage holin family protein [Aeromonas hydrophila]
MLAYLAFGGSSVWGGLVTYIQTVKREGRQFAWREAVLQVVVSGVVDWGFSFSIHEGAMDKTATMLPTAQQSDSRMDEFWNSLDAGLATPELAPHNLDVGLSDVACTVGAGGLELVGGIGELARQAGNYGRQNGGKDQGDYLENARANLAKKLAPVLDVVAGAGALAQSGADSLKEGMSVDAREAMTRSLASESPTGGTRLGDGAGDIDVWAMKMAQGVGSLLPMLASGGITGLAAKATIGRMVTTTMIKRGPRKRWRKRLRPRRCLGWPLVQRRPQGSPVRLAPRA